MGFPTWTLWGMGIAGAGVLLMLVLAYIAQSPHLIKRLGLTSYRLDLRARTFTGIALALLLLSLGFFLAGVPLGSTPTTTVEAPEEETQQITDTDESGAMIGGPALDQEPTAQATENVSPGSSSGAFGGLPSANRTATAEAAGSGETTAEESVPPTNTPENTMTPTPTNTPSPTPSPTPTMTPTPTLTPTPIFEETAIINVGSSTLWIKRTPNGQDDRLVRGGDIVILLPGHANMGGDLWREVKTVDGVIGWVLDSYLAYDDNSGG